MEKMMSDSEFGRAFFKMIVYLTVLTLVLISLGVLTGGPTDSKLRAQAEEYTQTLIAQRTQPVGTLNVGAIASTQEAEETVAEETVAEETIEVAKVGKSGQEVYDTACYICHNPGLTGAPKPGDVENWKPRIAKGIEVLYTNAISGFQGQTGVMPPKGGNLLLSDEEVRVAVDYLVNLVQ